MFYCDDCGEERSWPNSFFKSWGRCEVCGKNCVCNDVPSSMLPPVDEKRDVTGETLQDEP